MEIFQTTLLVVLSAIIFSPIFPNRIALLAYVLVVQVDLSGGSFESAAAIGLGNAWKTIVLPSVLLLRSRLHGLHMVRRTKALKLWTFFCLYVALGALWSPFPLSAVKQLGYLYAYTAFFLFAVTQWKNDEAGTYRVIIIAVLASIIGAAATTLITGKSLLGSRVTFLANPQTFTLYLVLSLAIIVGQASKRGTRALAVAFLSGLIFLFVVLSGGRTGFLAITMIFVVIVGSWLLSRTSWSRISLLMAMGLMLAALSAIAVVSFGTQLSGMVKGTRALQLVAVATRQTSFEDVRTGIWRFGMYEQMIGRIASANSRQKVLGRGTSSTAEIITKKLYWYRDYDSRTVDANRVAHNEFLRCLYEWGVIGLGLFVALIMVTIRSSLIAKKRLRDYESYVLIGSLAPILLFLVFENLFAMSATPSGVAIVLVLARIAHNSLKAGAE